MATKITVSTLKGGDGKTTLTILMGNNLAARGCKVLVVDLDPNNSTSMYYSSGIENIENICIEKNIFLALTRKDARSNIIATRKENVDLIPSSLDLSSIRTIDTKTLSKVISQVDGEYDYVIIDTAPTYDNHTISALYTADLIFTPVAPIKFTLSTTAYLRTKLYDELEEKVPNWYLIYNKWEYAHENFPTARQSQLAPVFESNFDNFLPVKIPRTPTMDAYTISDDPLSINSRAIGNKRLAKVINELVDMIDTEHKTQAVEKF
ncbi:MAG: AAA family ATPase [Spirochaetaceae bacterium]|nr:AAA family ATPase [Spirochaetaceae bacterium]